MHNMAPQPPEIILDLLAITALVGVIALMVSVQQTALLITDWGSLSPSSTKYLATGVTIFATLPTALINGRIQHALLQPLGSRLHRVILDANRSPIRADGGEPESLRCRDGMEAADREWKGALGIDSMAEKLRLPNILFAVIKSSCSVVSLRRPSSQCSPAFVLGRIPSTLA